MPTFHALAADAPGAPLRPFDYDPGALRPDEVEIEVHSCGICHSDLSMLNDEWGMSSYPLVPGHEVAGTVGAVGAEVATHKVGDRVGLGWHSRACMHCRQCMSGDHNLCSSQEGTIVGRHGGYADRVRCHHAFALPIPDAMDLTHAGPLLCGGITVFNPMVRFGVRPTDRVGVVGIGGLGHMALRFLRAWGCHVTAFTSTGAKADEAKEMGAHAIIDSRSDVELAGVAGSFEFIISTVNVPLNWDGYLNALAPKGRLHMVGAVLEPMAVSAFSLISGERSISGSPVGAPATIAMMLEFAARHGVAPVIETFPMEDANTALAHLRAGKARYRIVLTGG